MEQKNERNFCKFIILIFFCLFIGSFCTETKELIVDCDFPGGNIIVDSIKVDTVFVRQDLRDTWGDWFYWYFRVRGAAGRELYVHFTRGIGKDKDKNVPYKELIEVLGPAVSIDKGKTWKWLGSESVKGARFSYKCPADVEEVRFRYAMPYLESNLQGFIKRHTSNEHLKVDVLCKTRKGRDIELLHLGRLDGECKHRVLLTCRHHACEMMASYSLEGIMEAVLTDNDYGKWLRENVEFLIVPFMDKDGVEDGDQGKNRKPHDHNRDYGEKSIYPSVRALKELVPEWSGERLRFVLDMHCPWIRDARIYGARAIAEIVGKTQTGTLVFSTPQKRRDVPQVSKKRTPRRSIKRSFPKTCSGWGATLPGVQVSTVIEIAYARDSSGNPVTAESARALGNDLARALYYFLLDVKE